jgi:hypothetical protein
LLQVIRALRPPGRLAGGLYGWQQQGNQNANDGNHHQQLHQRETSPVYLAHRSLPSQNAHTSMMARPHGLQQPQKWVLWASGDLFLRNREAGVGAYLER